MSESHSGGRPALNSSMTDERDVLAGWATESLRGYPAVACVTLNFKQGLQMPHGWARLTADIARQQVKWLFRNVDRTIYGNQYKRSGKKTSRLVVNEGMDGFKRLHAHLAIGVPANISPVKFLELLENVWSRAHWGYGHGDMDLCENLDKWVSYITKTGTECIDDENTKFEVAEAKYLH